jgi:tetratricopeptide (TPR) repeat protein
LADRQRSPFNFLKQADNLLQKAKSLNPNYYETFTRQGESSLLKGKWQAAARRNPRAYFRTAEAALKKAAELNPKDIHTNLTMVRLSGAKAEWQIGRGQRAAAAQDIKTGLSFVQKSLDINPNYAETHVLKGILLQLLAKTETSEKKRLDTEVAGRMSLLKGTRINRNLQKLYAPYLQKK